MGRIEMTLCAAMLALAVIMGLAMLIGRMMRLTDGEPVYMVPERPIPVPVPEPAPKRQRLVIPDEFALVRHGWTDEQLKTLREMRDTYRKARG